MAVFNPDVPMGSANMPDWTNVTRPISQPEADKSRGIALSNMGNTIEGVAGLTDQTMKSVIGKDVRETVEKTRADFTSTLEQARNAQLGSVTSDGNDILPANSTPTSNPPPPAVVQGVEKLNAIQAAYSNGKINDTYYSQRLMADVTALRSKYPGYVDYIDQKVSSITGMNPANAYVQNLMQDINRAQTTKRTALDKAVDDAMKSGYPNSDKQIQALQQQGESYLPTFRQWYSEQTMLDSTLKRNQALRQDYKGRIEDYAKTREEDWTNEVGATIQNNMSTLITVSGVDKPQKALDLLQDAANNPGKYNDETMRLFANKILAQKNVVFSQLDARAAERRQDSTGRWYSYNSDITPAKVQEIKKNVGMYYDQIHDALMNGGAQGAGLAFARAQQAAAMLGSRKADIFQSEVGKDIMTYQVLNETMGPNWTAAITDSALRAGIDDSIRPLFTVRRQQGAAQPDAKTGGPAYTFKDMAGEALTLERQNKISSSMRARYLGAGIDTFVNDIVSPEAPDQAKINALKFFFSKEGQGILPNFKDDSIDPATGKYLPGRQSIWNKLTSEAMVREVGKLNAKDPSIGQMYKKALETEAGAYLYYKDIQNLNQLTGHDDLHIKYNDGGGKGTPRITLIDNKGQEIKAKALIPGQWGTTSPSADRTSPYINNALQTVERINAALAGMDRVEKAVGNGNGTDQLLNFLINSQAQIGKNWEGLPAKLMDAIAASAGRGKLKELMEQGKK
jgi:hypothetical protein